MQITILCGRCAAELACPSGCSKTDTKTEAGKFAKAAGWAHSKKFGWLCPPEAHLAEKPKPKPKPKK